MNIRLLLFVPKWLLVATFVISMAAGDGSAAVDPGGGGSRRWYFKAPQRAPLTMVVDHDEVRNPMDRFVLARLGARSWRPSLMAEPPILLRRIYLDLLGPLNRERLEARPDDLELGVALWFEDRTFEIQRFSHTLHRRYWIVTSVLQSHRALP